MSYEKPKLEKIEKGKDYVFEKFDKVGFDIKEFPELHERLVELSNMPDSHFDDAVNMSQIIELIWDDIEKQDSINFSKEELKLACLFHDIGKSGPSGADKNQRTMIEQLFNPLSFKINSEKFSQAKEFKGKKINERKRLMRELPINRILDIQDFPNNEEIKEYLSSLKLHIYDFETKKIKEEQLDLGKHSMIELWREHDYWTLQLLKKYGDKKISPELMIVASSHHTLEGHDPAMIDGDLPAEAIALETLDKYSIITLVDKYQAFIDREEIEHEETIIILRKMIEESNRKGIINHGNVMKDKFLKYVQILKKHPEIVALVKESPIKKILPIVGQI